jgi:hypothetical protein
VKSKLFEKLDHDLVASIRNFQVAAGLLSGEAPEVAMAAELIRASIEQLEGTRAFLQKTAPNKSLESKQSTAAQK